MRSLSFLLVTYYIVLRLFVTQIVLDVFHPLLPACPSPLSELGRLKIAWLAKLTGKGERRRNEGQRERSFPLQFSRRRETLKIHRQSSGKCRYAGPSITALASDTHPHTHIFIIIASSCVSEQRGYQAASSIRPVPCTSHVNVRKVRDPSKER